MTIKQHPPEQHEIQINSSISMMVSFSVSFQLVVEEDSLEILNRYLHFKSSRLLIYWLFVDCKKLKINPLNKFASE